MFTVSRLKCLWLTRFSKPAGDRVIYRAIQQQKPRKILEIGMGSTARTLRMLNLAAPLGEGPLRYVAIDLFEARSATQPAGMSLKDAHRFFKSTPAQAQLIPGDPSALTRVANSLQQMDLVLISSDYDDSSLAGAWFYLPRMLHEGSQVYRELRSGAGGPTHFERLALSDLTARASVGRGRRAA